MCLDHLKVEKIDPLYANTINFLDQSMTEDI